MNDGTIDADRLASELPEEGEIAEIREPWMKLQIFTPVELLRHGDGPGDQETGRTLSSRNT